MLTPTTKLYVQLAPDTASRQAVLALQRQLPPDKSVRSVKAASLHVTILHIGLLARVISDIQRYSNASAEQIMHCAETLLSDLQAIIDDSNWDTITLQTTGVAHFGIHNATLVITFQTTPALTALHRASLHALQAFFASVGIEDIDGFMRSSDNFQYALSLKPHLTVAQHYAASIDIADLGTLRFNLMPLTYDAS